MKIKKLEVKNFRLLKEIVISLEERTTVIVGRNNSGKTSLAVLFRQLLSQNSPSFKLEDFSLGVLDQFWTAFKAKQGGAQDVDIRKTLPAIEAKLTITYDSSAPSVGLLTDFIVDLNPQCTDALIEIRYELGDGKISALFENIDPGAGGEPELKEKFFRTIKDRVARLYKTNLAAIDPNDNNNRRTLEWTKLRALLHNGFIGAQRGLDDTTDKENDVLGNILGVLFSTAMSEAADPKDQTTAEKLEAAIQGIQENIDSNFNEQLKGLVPAFALFGYPGLRDPKLRTQTALDVARLLNNHTKVHYAGENGIHLPETYNGLGARNLIFMLLKLLEFFKKWQATQPAPAVHLVFIEEPEAHLHPQMQEVFISKLGEIADIFAQKFNNGEKWPVQFVVTTHSSHMANRAPFKAMRYFLATDDVVPGVAFTKMKDLGKGFGGALKDDEAFLHQYMTLTRCDLFFADKAVLIEGTSERLLLPKMIEKLDATRAPGSKLASQYVSVMEVGGAYAHRFFKLLEFLELRALIITDIDSVTADKYVACKVSEGARTSNGCIKAWFASPDVTPSDLIEKSDGEKTKDSVRLAYQVPEAAGKGCGRSFEDAFILANGKLFNLTGTSPDKDADDAWAQARDEKKSEFALRHAIDRTDWTVPRYIKEGLEWLADLNGASVPQPGPLATPAVQGAK